MNHFDANAYFEFMNIRQREVARVFARTDEKSPIEARFLSLLLGAIDLASSGFFFIDKRIFTTAWSVVHYGTIPAIEFKIIAGRIIYQWIIIPQMPIQIEGHNYCLDFDCQLGRQGGTDKWRRPANLYFECDGYDYHSDKERFTKDRDRDRLMQSIDYKVNRFSGSEINNNRLVGNQAYNILVTIALKNKYPELIFGWKVNKDLKSN